MNNVIVTINYGSRTLRWEAPEGTTPASILSDSFVKMSLGYGDNVRAMRSGVEVTNVPLKAEGTEPVGISVETKANDKQ